ncbi:F0F1 ATP synthase subunit delta [Skermania piniformis]|uniref:ATP synthase subunit delta n=1 Tax=Skermania pinensis TaxID=39122 RepID=A0ABX8SA83_9ACTN|nr:F0F1 ATP synthase subunit delta [Skermania piniformis]QXQ14759.1 F0F1 ATP synthase subunit delta [Skermania piniformis]
MAGNVGLESLKAASREAAIAVQDVFETQVAGLADAGVATLSDELAAVTDLLGREVTLRRVLAARSDDPAAKQAMLDRLFAGKIGEPALSVLRGAAEQRWSASRDMVGTLAQQARIGVLIQAERADQLDDVEDELFRVGRVLDAYPRLAALLGDRKRPTAGRLGLLDDVFAGRVSRYTTSLLQQEVRRSAGDITGAVAALADLAAARRSQSVAHVVAAAPLVGDQQRRLESVLSRIYGRTITVQLEIDPDVLGGLRITVGDEVVDGTIASRLADASAHLPH